MAFSIKKRSLNEVLLEFAYYPWIFLWTITPSYLKDFIHPYGLLRLYQPVGILMLIGKLYLDYAGKKRFRTNFVFLAMIVIGFIVSFRNSNASMVYYTILVMAASSNADTDKMIKNTIIIQVFSMMATVAASLLGVIPNIATISFASGYARLRKCFGYTFCTYIPNYFFSIVMEYVYIRRRKSSSITLIEMAVMIMLNIVIYSATQTRTTFLLVCLIMLMQLYDWFAGKTGLRIRRIIIVKLINFIYKWCFPFMAALSVFFAVFYTKQNKLMYMINRALSQRLRLSNEGFRNYGLSLTGVSVEWMIDIDNYNYIDSSYINILICYGVIIFAFVLFGFTVTMRSSIKTGNKALCAILFIWSARAFIDPQLFLIWFNPFMLCIMKTIHSDYKNEVRRGNLWYRLSAHITIKN